MPKRFGRRAFLVRTGVIGAALALADSNQFPGLSPSASTLSPSQLAPVFDALASDTINGLVAFVVPGPDPYSIAQGVSDVAPGGIDALATGFMLNALDNFYPVPQEPLRLLAQSLCTGINDNLPEIPGLPVVTRLAEQLDLALGAANSGQGTFPLSLMVALLLNFLATLIDPTAVNGDFLSPFARLSFAQKTQAFALLEGEASTVAAMIDSNLSEPAKESLSGLLEFLGGALVEFAAFGTYSEFGAFDASTRTVTMTPVGWTISQYLTVAPGRRPPEGWDEMKGYLGGETQASA
ncbi:MAG TPA: hypothetical protein VMV14_11450 [Acidimicrobiales bacterium]|nr:hypothetical protein [Acidimicrobiales bacterium]